MVHGHVNCLTVCCIHCTALCLFSLPAGSLNRLEPLFCFSAGTLQPHTQSTSERQCDRETVQPNGRQKTRCSESRPRLLPRVVHVVQFDATPGRKRCIDSTNKNNNATQQLRNVCSTCCTTSDPPVPPPFLFGLQIKIQHMLFN